MKKFLGSLCVTGALLSSVAFADQVPVVDLSPSSGSVSGVSNTDVQNGGQAQANDQSVANMSQAAPTQTLTLDQRVAKLEQQISNITKMNLPQQVSDLQQQVQQLNGQLQVQAHDLKTLNDQQSSFYKDLDSRITQISNLSNNGSTSTSDESDNSDNSNSRSSTIGSSSGNKKNIAPSRAPTQKQADDAAAYQNAFKLLTDNNLAASTSAFKSYLEKFPAGNYQANSHYWLGEIYMRQNKNDLAANEFHTILTEFSSSNKVADSTLKLGMIANKQGKVADAKKFFQSVKTKFPGSTAAQLSSVYLQQLQALANT
jgi:tol-pal system protein YbgF